MKRRLLSILLALVLTLALLPTAALADVSVYLAGSGTENEPYKISTAEELKAFRDLVNNAKTAEDTKIDAVLENDIDLEGEAWTPIAQKSISIEGTEYGYCGTFDGNGHTISGLNVMGNFRCAGLFGVVTGATIKNLTVAGKVSSNDTLCKVGGIAGYADSSTIENCTNWCTVTGSYYAGGIVGWNWNGNIIGCANFGTISGKSAGGLCGVFNSDSTSETSKNYSTIRDCYNVGTVSGVCAGGIAGCSDRVDDSNYPNRIANCYNTGKVTTTGSAYSYAGEIVGSISSKIYASVDNCYYLDATSNKAVGDDEATVTKTEPKSIREFADGTVRDLLIDGRTDSPWDDTCRYVPEAGKYLPVFKWQKDYTPAPDFPSESSGSRFSYSTISASAGENGKVSPSGDLSVRSDLGQTFVFTPDKGYRVADVLVNGKSVGALRSYTFATARSDQTIEVIFEKIPAFVDVPAGSYYEEAVNWALENWITEGTSDTLFSPDAPCTRAQAVTFLWRAAGCPAPKSYTTAFEDVTSGSYYYQAVLWAIENGIAQGTSETTFEPDALCTRAQIVTLLFRYKAASGMIAVTLAELLGGYADSAEIPAYSRSALNWAISANVLQGSGEKLLPNDACTRVQIVTLLYRTMP